jgi:hypothetical protein
VAPRRDPSVVELLTEAAERGFQLEERPLRGQSVSGWRRGDDTRFPCYLSEREALRGMADPLRRADVFE